MMPQFEEEAAPRRFFFRKENRLLKRADFLRVYGEGRVYRRSLVHVFIVKETAKATEPGKAAAVGEAVVGEMLDPGQALHAVLPPTRLGITATKKSGNSVKRNRARRLVRESFRLSLPDMKPGFSMVVNVTRATTAAPYQRVKDQLVAIWKEAGVL